MRARVGLRADRKCSIFQPYSFFPLIHNQRLWSLAATHRGPSPRAGHADGQFRVRAGGLAGSGYKSLLHSCQNFIHQVHKRLALKLRGVVVVSRLCLRPEFNSPDYLNYRRGSELSEKCESFNEKRLLKDTTLGSSLFFFFFLYSPMVSFSPLLLPASLQVLDLVMPELRLLMW